MSLAPSPLLRDVQLRVELLEDVESLQGLQSLWNGLSQDLPTRRWEWLYSWSQCFLGGSDRLWTLAVYQGEDLVGLAPWYRHRSPLWGREVRFLGSGDAYSDYMTLLCRNEQQQAIADRIAAWLLENHRRWDVLCLERIAAGEEAVERMLSRLQEHGCQAQRQATESCWQVPLPTTWDEYVARLSKSRRERVRQLVRRKFDTEQAQLVTAQTLQQVEQGLDILTTLHARRRRSLGDEGCFADERFERFLFQVARRFFDSGDLRLQWVELEGRPVAVEFDLSGGRSVYFYQSGMEPSVENERPGWLGTIAALRRAIDEGFTTFDFMGGNEAYKSHWKADEQPMWNVRVAAPGALSRSRHELWTQKQRGKQCLKALWKRWKKPS